MNHVIVFYGRRYITFFFKGVDGEYLGEQHVIAAPPSRIQLLENVPGIFLLFARLHLAVALVFRPSVE